MVPKDALGVRCIDEQFKGSFSGQGQPAESSARPALVAVLQFAAGLTDHQAADGCASHIVGMTHSKFAGLLRCALQHSPHSSGWWRRLAFAGGYCDLT